MYRLVKRNFGNEIYATETKTYATKQDAINAGNSWEKDCTLDQNITRGRNFEVILI